MSIKEFRSVMRYNIRKYLDLPNPVDYNLHLNLVAGVGKTTIAAEELENADSLFIYLTNNHKLGTEQINNQVALFDKIQIESRRRLCRNPDYRKLADYGINIKHFCPNCPYINVCDYYTRMIEIWGEPQSWIGVHHHLGGLVNTYVNENDVDVVVIDEYFLPSIFKHTIIPYSHLVNTINLISRMEDSREKNLIMDYLNEFAFSLQNKFVNTVYLYSQTFDYFRRSVRKNILLREFAEKYEIRLSNYYFKKKKIFKNIVTPIVEAIIDINKHYVPMTLPDHLEYINNVIQVSIGESKRYVDISRYDLDALDLNCKIMILDATTPTDFYQKLFLRNVKSLEKQLAINSVIYQISSAKYVMRTIDNNIKTRNRLLNIVKLIVDKHKETALVLSRMKYEEDIKMVNPELIITDHYPVLGSNEYEKINICIIFGTPEPKRNMLKRQAILLDCDQDELMYILRETNIIQGIHRIRPALKLGQPTYVYLLTSLPLPFMNVKHISIGKLERLLKNEISGYVTEETEDRIREDILSMLEEDDYSFTDIMSQISGNNVVVSEIINRLMKDDMIEAYKVNTGGRGRKPTYYKIK